MADNITIKDGGGTNVTLGAKDVGSVQYPQSTPVTPGWRDHGGDCRHGCGWRDDHPGHCLNDPDHVSDGSGALSVDDNGGSLTVDGSVSISGTATVSEAGTWVQVDDAAFTPATSKIAMVGAEFDDSSPDSVDEGDGGAIRMSGNRNLYVRIRDDAGNERGLNINANGDAGVTARSGAFASGSIASGAIASGAIASGAIATGAIAAGAASIADNEDAARRTVTVASRSCSSAAIRRAIHRAPISIMNSRRCRLWHYHSQHARHRCNQSRQGRGCRPYERRYRRYGAGGAQRYCSRPCWDHA
jgi:hypothetical protein